MNGVPIRLVKEAVVRGVRIPLNIALVDVAAVAETGRPADEALAAVARFVDGPIAINVFDMDAVTVTSDGIMVRGAVVMMAAGDMGRIHPEFGSLPMPEVVYSDELVAAEPHLRQWQALHAGRRLFRGPDLGKKLIPVHNCVMTGRAINNNSASEMLNVVTMEEILFPILGQIQLMHDGPVLAGPTGEHISVGIGMTVAEDGGRVFPFRQFRAGDTAHSSGAYARTLKSRIPCLAAPKAVLARHIAGALRVGMVPGEHLGCSPAVLCVARALGAPIAFDRITAMALEELASVGIGPDVLQAPADTMSEDEVIERADEVVPGLVDAVCVSAGELVSRVEAP